MRKMLSTTAVQVAIFAHAYAPLLPHVDSTLTLRVCAGMLSPGELQRLAVARVLYHRPALAVMDEPISSLDAETGISLLKTIHTAGIAVIVTSQPDTPLCNVQQSMSWQMLSL